MKIILNTFVYYMLILHLVAQERSQYFKLLSSKFNDIINQGE